MDLLQRIERRATDAADAIAHISGNRSITYGELLERSSALACQVESNLGDDRTPIAVLGHREPEMLIAFLGIVKSGRSYIPLDTALPKQRVQKVLSAAGVRLCLTPADVVSLARSKIHRSLREISADDPFYIIFTSGSTGEPKGVVISHACLSHFVFWMLSEQQFDPQEVFLNQAPFSFDLSVMDMYCSLASAGTLFSVSRDLVADPKALYRALAQSGVTTWVSTPSFVHMCLVERTFDERMLPRLKRFLFCGETLPLGVASELLERFPNAQVWNTYGPTEATVATTSVAISSDLLRRYPALPVGRPMKGTEVFVVDETGGSVPEGETGEIIIAGPNVGLGYLNRPDLTSGVFFEHRGGRAYRTGDRGRVRDNLLFFEGRVDDQVKLNGYRIELGDLEYNFRQIPLVRDVAVVPLVKNGVTRALTAFVVTATPSPESEIELAATLRTLLAERVPRYMLPRRLVFVDALPLTPNGKVDRIKLSALL